MFLLVWFPLVKVVLTTNTDLVPWLRVIVLKVLVVSPRVTEVLPVATVVLPKVTVVRVQEIDDVPQERAYLVLRTEILPLVKEVLLDRKLVFHSLPESRSDFFAGLGDFALTSGLRSI